MYNTYGQVYVDNAKLMNLQFNRADIDNLNYLVNSGIHINTNNLVYNMGYNYEYARLMVYMYSICCGKIEIDNIDSFSRHLKRINKRVVTDSNILVGDIKQIPRLAVVGRIPSDTPFAVYNSANKRCFVVKEIGKDKIQIITDVRPVLLYGAPKGIPGVIELKGKLPNSGAELVEVYKGYYGLLNRYAILISLKKPESLIDGVVLLSLDGTKIYLYAINIGIRVYNATKNNVLKYGYTEHDIYKKISELANEITKGFNCVAFERLEGNQEFTSIYHPNTDDSIYM